MVNKKSLLDYCIKFSIESYSQDEKSFFRLTLERKMARTKYNQ